MNAPALRHLYIRAPNWVGDLVMSTPVLHAAVESTNFERVTIGVRSHLAAVLAGGQLERHVSGFASSQEEAALLGRLAPDAAVLLSNSFGAAWRVFRAGIPVRIGSALSARRALLTHSLVPPTSDGRRVPSRRRRNRVEADRRAGDPEVLIVRPLCDRHARGR